jgi:serine/threonine-protein kinase
VGIALVIAAVLAVSGGGGDSTKQAATAVKKHAKKHKASKAAPAAPAPAQPAPQPTQSAPTPTKYQVPQPAGTSAAQGWRLNTQGKQLSDRGDFSSAVPTLERAARAFPAGTTAAGNLQYAYTLFNLGHALVQAGRPADAVPVLEERMKNPDQRATVQAELDAARQAAAHG